MPYYSDADRRRAATKRKLNSQFRQILKSPEDFYDIMGVSVPHVSHRPELDDYGLPSDIDEQLKVEDEEYIREQKSLRSIAACIGTAVIIGLFFYAVGLIDESKHPEYFLDGKLINNAVALGALAIWIAGIWGLIFIWSWARGVEPKQTYRHSQYKDYRLQLSYYEYWQRKHSKDHWNKMTGHAFEQAVANLFRNIGFTAEVSNRGGDGGVDIILQKNSRRVAVQCKRYKSPVGPHVIRDLWGTMRYLGFDEGCIVTTTGFTKGVTSFAEDKDIFLIDLQDILKATGDGGEAFLRQKIGED